MAHKSSSPLFLISSLLVLAATTTSHAWPKILPHHFGRYDVPPSVYGYPLDEMSPGYYGGARYKEYYSYGRGGFYGLADFPGPVPDYVHGPWFKHRYWPHGSTSLPKVYNPDDAPCCAHIVVHVPADAQVWLEGQPTQQTGSTRTFVSPPLPPKQNYAYQVRVRWKGENGVVEQTQNIEVQAGNQVAVHFPLVRPTEVIEVTPTFFPAPQGK